MIRKVPEAELVSELKKEIDIIVEHFEATGEIPGRSHAGLAPAVTAGNSESGKEPN